VKAEHYAMMRQAILNSLTAMLGERFDVRAADAWGAAFDMLAEALQKPETATPEELKLISAMFGRKFEAAKAAGGNASADSFFDRKLDS
jgi:hypothetical protein